MVIRGNTLVNLKDVSAKVIPMFLIHGAEWPILNNNYCIITKCVLTSKCLLKIVIGELLFNI
jgi:hypothetical protein